MSISVIIPTYNGAHKIMQLIDKLEAQSYLPDELIIIIDGSTDNTEALLRSRSFSLTNVNIIVQANGGRAKVRNVGAAAAKGDLLIFFDDDMRPAANALQLHEQHHHNVSNCILTGAQIDEDGSSLPDIRRYKAFLTRKWSRGVTPSMGQPLTKEQLFMTAAHCSMPKLIFNQLKGFDERLSDAEDYDFAIRAHQQKIPVFYNDQIIAWHQDLIDCTSYVKRMRQYAQAQKQLVLLNPQIQNKYVFLQPSGLKAFFFSLFCFRFWMTSIDKQVWKYILPKFFRYRLYDWIMTANGSFYPNKVAL
jgi:glycosyltransferase involved in cell wall biosynthesis